MRFMNFLKDAKASWLWRRLREWESKLALGDEVLLELPLIMLEILKDW